jgi:hypothetical protein
MKKAYALDSGINISASLGEFNMFANQYGESFKYFKKVYNKSKTLNSASILGMHRIGWAY